MSLAGDLLLLLGALFSCLGALGLVRMPDVYNRLQAGTKSATLGAVAVLAGIGVHHPDWWGSLLVIGIMILFTNPVGSSSIARAALLCGVRPWHARERAQLPPASGDGEQG